VFLLNSILTTVEGIPLAHKNIGWETFTDEAIKVICKHSKYTIYLLLGATAQKKEQLIVDSSRKYSYDIIKLPHPSPQSAHTGFFFSKPFTKINGLLANRNLEPIDWRL
jgi:uracil-DNA glycosylase